MADLITELHPFCIQDEIWMEEITPGYPMIHIRNADATATIALHGAHLTHYARRDEMPIIFTSQAAIFREGKGNSRRIIVKKSGGNSSIIWNPGQEKGGALADLLDEEITQFICAESGNVLKETITLAADSTHTLSLTISSET